MKEALKNIQWKADELGLYWLAEYYEDEKHVGVMGTYYDLGNDGLRMSQEDQMVAINKRFELIG